MNPEIYTRREAETVAIPFKTLGNKSILTAEQLVEDPYLAAFVKRFSNCFEHVPNGDYLIFYPDGVPA